MNTVGERASRRETVTRCIRLVVSVAIASLMGAGCGVLPEDEAATDVPLTPQGADLSEIHLRSGSGCRIDSDCSAGMFCFQSQCVWECVSDADCADGATCSQRSQCVVASGQKNDDGEIDAVGASSLRQAANSVEVWPPVNVFVPPGAPFVDVQIRTARTVPERSILYTLTFSGDEGAREARRAEGDRDFTLIVPTGRAGSDDPEPEVVQVVTSLGSRTLVLVPAQPREGVYSGVSTPPAFGGASLPFEFALETEPAGVYSLTDATQAWLLVSTNVNALVSLPVAQDDAEWVRQPLVYDDSIEAWVSTFQQRVDARALFGEGAPADVVRAIRVEIQEEDGVTLYGAVADRWRGFFDRISADGVRSAGLATIAGNFRVERVARFDGAAMVRDDGFSDGDVSLRPPPSLSACQDTIFAPWVSPDSVVIDDEGAPPPVQDCDGAATVEAFRVASASRRTRCALAVADAELSGDTIQRALLALLDPAAPNPGGLSFSEYVQACASESSPICRPTPEVLCARELVAHAFRDASASGDAVARLSAAYDGLTREAYTGRQLAAFYIDSQTRLDWLRSGEAPAFLASTLREYNEAILSRWRRDVLVAHLDGVFGQLDDAGLGVLARVPTDPEARSTRAQLLLDLSNSWRAAADALSLLAARQNVLYQEDRLRGAAAHEIRTTMFRLYVSAAILQELHRESGATAFGAAFGSGFSNLVRELNRLSMTFNNLAFARDAEVVTSRSLDPEANQRSLLREREVAARDAVREALDSVDLILDEAQQTEVNELVLRTRYEDEIVAIRNELIELCGVPVGCEASDIGQVPECDVPTQAGACGFVVERGDRGRVTFPGPTDEVSVSDAGLVLLSLQEAMLAQQSVEEGLRARTEEANLLGATLEAFADAVVSWDDRRRTVNVEVDRLTSEIISIADAQMQAELQFLVDSQTLRQQAYLAQRADVQRWNTIRVDGVERDIRQLTTINALNATASVLDLAGERVDTMAAALRDSQPAIVGTSTDPSFAARLGIRFGAFIASTVLATTATGLNITASTLEVSLQRQQMFREAELTHLSELADLRGMESALTLGAIEANLSALNLRSEQEIRIRNALIDALERRFDAEMAHDRDLIALRDRRDAWMSVVLDLTRLEYELIQAELTVLQRELAYFEIVQRAQLLDDRFRRMQLRYQDISQLLGSPDVLFSFANRMERAESRIDRARRALEDWLVALEYYAVRPFVDQRLAIMLARNPGQLEAIANELLRLQRVCGGPVTDAALPLSLRDDLLGLGYANLEDGGALRREPGDQLREILARAEVPQSYRIPWTSSYRVGERIEAGNVWAVHFDLSVSSFANLERTCNAKLTSIAVALVGDDLGEGLPVVSIAYDGSGSLRSCQPGIDVYAGQFGPDATAFASVTPFRTAGRTVSPIAGIGTTGPAAVVNATLEGLPLAAGYTVLIDLDHPSNQTINWDALSDIHIEIRYLYQDVFPAGQCE